MLKQKLSKKAVEGMIEKCRVTTEDAVKMEILERDKKDNSKVITSYVDLKKIRTPEFIQEVEYLLGQIGVYHTTNKLAIYEQLAFLPDFKDWTENDPIVLNQLVRLGMMTSLINIFKEEKVNGKNISVTNLNRGKGRIKPVIHEEKTTEDK